jgi:hypothetical protein
MCELMERDESRAGCAEPISPRTRRRAGMPDRGSRVAVRAVIALALGLSLLAAFATYGVNRKNEPSDEALTTNFLSHEARFDELVRMLASDHLSAVAIGATGINLATVARLDENPARVTMYSGLSLLPGFWKAHPHARRPGQSRGTVKVLPLPASWSAATPGPVLRFRLAHARNLRTHGRSPTKGELAHTPREDDGSSSTPILIG